MRHNPILFCCTVANLINGVPSIFIVSAARLERGMREHLDQAASTPGRVEIVWVRDMRVQPVEVRAIA